MRSLSTGLTFVVAVVHIWFLALETQVWDTPAGMAALATSQSFAQPSAVFAARQGLFNGFLAAGLLCGLLLRKDAFKIFFLVCAVAAGTLDGLALGKAAFMIEALPALGALLILLLGRITYSRQQRRAERAEAQA